MTWSKKLKLLAKTQSTFTKRKKRRTWSASKISFVKDLLHFKRCEALSWHNIDAFDSQNKLAKGSLLANKIDLLNYIRKIFTRSVTMTLRRLFFKLFQRNKSFIASSLIFLLTKNQRLDFCSTTSSSFFNRRSSLSMS